MFCVPIINKDRCLGVVAVNNYNQNGVFTKEDMQVIEVVAGQSAIAIDNAHVYSHLKEKNRLLKQSITIHNRFYQLIIEGRGIKKVISMLERMISSTAEFYTDVNLEDAANAFPIRRGDDILGALLLERPFQSFSEMDQIAIEQASLSIAL